MDARILSRIDRRPVLVRSEKATPPRHVFGSGLTGLVALAVTIALAACQSPPDWVSRGWQESDVGANRAAALDAVRSGQELRRSGPLMNDSNAVPQRPWYWIGPQQSAVVPSGDAMWPQAQIVKPPRLRTFTPSPTPPERSDFTVPRWTTIVPSPHPGIRCAPDMLGGQRCSASP